MPDDSFAIETHGITRDFDTRQGFLFREVTHTEALRGIDLSVERGSNFGLLGPNGGGKTWSRHRTGSPSTSDAD